MAITLAKVQQLLAELQIPQAVVMDKPERAMVHTRWDFSDPEVGAFSLHVMVMMAEPRPGGFGYLVFRAVQLSSGLAVNPAQLEPSKQLALLQYLAHESYSNRIGTWGYEPSDGGIYVSGGIALEDGEVTLEQFQRYLAVIVDVGREGYRDIRRIVAHGDPTTPLTLQPVPAFDKFTASMETQFLVRHNEVVKQNKLKIKI